MKTALLGALTALTVSTAALAQGAVPHASAAGWYVMAHYNASGGFTGCSAQRKAGGQEYRIARTARGWSLGTLYRHRASRFSTRLRIDGQLHTLNGRTGVLWTSFDLSPDLLHAVRQGHLAELDVSRVRLRLSLNGADYAVNAISRCVAGRGQTRAGA